MERLTKCSTQTRALSNDSLLFPGPPDHGSHVETGGWPNLYGIPLKLKPWINHDRRDHGAKLYAYPSASLEVLTPQKKVVSAPSGVCFLFFFRGGPSEWCLSFLFPFGTAKNGAASKTKHPYMFLGCRLFCFANASSMGRLDRSGHVGHGEHHALHLLCRDLRLLSLQAPTLGGLRL